MVEWDLNPGQAEPRTLKVLIILTPADFSQTTVLQFLLPPLQILVRQTTLPLNLNNRGKLVIIRGQGVVKPLYVLLYVAGAL